MIERYGVDNPALIPGVFDPYGGNPGHLAKKTWPTRWESWLKDKLPEILLYTGKKTFWIDLNDGRRRNPDFLVLPYETTRKVIEVAGSHWHTPEEMGQRVREYQSVGVSCLVIWDHELKRDKKACLEMVRKFAADSLSPSETTRSASLRDDDMVQPDGKAVRAAQAALV